MFSRLRIVLHAGRPVLEMLLVVAACVASGALQCGQTPLTPAERQGADLYRRMCAVCHGSSGEGYRADEATALRHPAFLASASDMFMRKAIMDGRKGTVMSAWSVNHGGPLSATDVFYLISFLRTWERVPRAVLDERALSGDVARGQVIYGEHCVGCHGTRGVSGKNVNIGEAGLLSTSSNGFLRFAIRYGRHGTPMPAFVERIGEQGVDDVVALLRSWEPRFAVPPEPVVARPSPLPLGPLPLNPRGPEPKGFRAHPERTSMRVIRTELKRGARMAFLDARAPPDYVNEHIPGAVSVPFYDVERYAAELPKDAWLICYCSCPHAESGMLAQALSSKGFKKVTVLDEGLRGWVAQKYETRKGAEP